MINNIKNMIKNYSREIECHAIIKNNLENNHLKSQENLINGMGWLALITGPYFDRYF
ncbi:hypothetical protein [Spiroplasma endosymbiont of Dasysyrphus albostriatus]|uniref:hypothetical protein n=1 Tax=Spiroplasma endosymbiont of Dasysyrphus albostriatus TaxID=3066299 RepID=UPI0030CED635